MSIAALRWTRAAVRLHGADMTPTEKLLLRHLGDLVRDDGTWCETKADLRVDLVVSAAALDRAVRGLVKRGLLRVEARRQGGMSLANRWCVPLDVPLVETPPPPRFEGDPPPRNDPPSSPFPPSVPAEPAAGPHDPMPTTDEEHAMTAPDADQMGFDLDLPEVKPAPEKPRRDGGPAQRIVAAYCAAFVTEHGRQPASERGRVAGQARAMLDQGHTEAELVAAAEALGATRFTYLAEQVRIVRAQTRRVETARNGAVEGWQGAGQAPSQTWIYG